MAKKLYASDGSDEELGEYYGKYGKLSDGTPERVRQAFLSTRAGEDLRETLGDSYFEKIKPELRQEAITFRNYLRNAYFSVIAVYSVISDVEMCAKMINRYPWHSTDISRGDHFEFVWSNFTNHCYIFEERTKQLGKQFNSLSHYYGGDSINVGSWVKRIKRELGEHIAFRGAHVHEWSRSYEGFEFFKQVDFLTPFKPEYEQARRYLYQPTKLGLKNEILSTRKKMLKLLREFDPDPIEYLLPYLKAFDEYLGKSET